MKYLQLAARIFMVALLVVLVALVLGSKDQQLSLLPFAASALLVTVIEVAANVAINRIGPLLSRLQERLGRETAGMACVLLLWLVLSVPSLVVLTAIWLLVPAAAPIIDGPFKLCLLAPFVVAVKAVFAVWTGTPFRLIRFVFKPSLR